MLFCFLMGHSVLLTDVVKNYRSGSQLACMQGLLVLSFHGKAKARVARGQVARRWVTNRGVDRCLVAKDWAVRGPLCTKKSQDFVLRTYHIQLVGWGKGVTY